MAKKNNGNGKVINSQAAMDKAVKSICDILRRDNSDKRTPDELMAIINDSQSQIEECLKVLR